MAKVDVGDRAPDFELPGTGDKTYRLSDYGGRNLILAFYPGDATTVCTKQFCNYRDQGDRLDALDAEVRGISPQSVDSHAHWVKVQDLCVPLMADEDLAVHWRRRARAAATPAREAPTIAILFTRHRLLFALWNAKQLVGYATHCMGGGG